jgi:hypothetical protein
LLRSCGQPQLFAKALAVRSHLALVQLEVASVDELAQATGGANGNVDAFSQHVSLRAQLVPAGEST